MLRFPIAGMLLAILLSAPFASAQQSEDAWRKLFMQGAYFTGEKNYAKAEESLLGALHEAERFGPDDVRVGSTLNTLGLLYRADKKFVQAENAYRRSLEILEKVYSSESMDAGNINFNIAAVMIDQGRQNQAMPYMRKAQAIYEKLLGGNSITTASVLCMEGDAYRAMKDYNAAEAPLHRCADAREADGGIENAEFADALYSLAMVYEGQGKYTRAEPEFKLTEKIRERTLGLTSPVLAQTMQDHAALLKSMGRNAEADRLIVLASAIRRTQKKSN